MCVRSAVYLGVFQHSYFKSHLFDLQPVLGTPVCVWQRTAYISCCSATHVRA